MKKFIAILGLALISQQSLATVVAGIDFLDVADTLVSSQGSYTTNYQSGSNNAESVVDGNGATYIFSNDAVATVDMSFGGDIFDVSDVNLSILFVGDGGHSGTVTLLGGTSDGSSMSFGVASGEGYTNFNSQQGDTVYGIFSETLDLSGFSGTFTGVSLNVSGESAVPSLVGTTAVPVPAAVWLFGSGLLGLVGAARRKRK